MSTEASRSISPTVVEIVCSTLNGDQYLAAFLGSLRAQTHTAWRLWLRDDGSTDATVSIAKNAADSDARIHIVDGPVRLGVVQGYSRLLSQLPGDAGYVMFADQDDVWLADKIERTLAAMHTAEARVPGPRLVHTDLTVVDADLRVIDQSFWRYAGVKPEMHSLRRLIVRNVVTGATAMINRALRERVADIPAEAAVHDWWIACVAVVFGEITAIPAQTVLYRQHGANSIGAQRPSSSLSWHELAANVPGAMRRTTKLRAQIAAAARQARAFLSRYHDDLSEDDRAFLDAYSRIPERSWFRRRIEVAKLHLLPEHGIIQRAGILLRA